MLKCNERKCKLVTQWYFQKFTSVVMGGMAAADTFSSHIIKKEESVIKAKRENHIYLE